MKGLILVLVSLLGLLASATAADAQFETPNRAFHNATSFRLEGRHLAVPCESCHLRGVYKGTPATCYECHWIRRQDDKFKTQLGTQCDLCHRPASWSMVRWDHGAATGMPLNAAHRTIGCEACHKDAEFRTTSVNCISCHQRDFQAARNPNHVAGGFPVTCDNCHRPADTTFTQATFDHNASFPLVGTHAAQSCQACHANGVFAGTPRDCVGCHRADYQRAQSPNHVAAGFPTTCDTCHRPTDPSWRGASTAGFNHNTVFQLVGVHATQACQACHVNNVYRGTARECLGCHRTQYERTTNPPHVSAGFSTNCETCHRPTDATWRGGTAAGFNHNAVFQLVGVHAAQACQACHVNNVFRGTPRDCVGCHRTDYERTTNPSHASAGFSTSCETCHRPTDTTWRSGTASGFNHNVVFQLVGVHATQACQACHANNVYRGTARDCVGCHRTDYERTTSPSHASAGFSTSCETCHRPTDTTWRGGTAAGFNHNAVFQLVGVHASQACTACHVNNVYRGTPRDCVGCHRTQYDRTTSPPHAAAGFPTTCDQCHRPADAAWRGVTFAHTTFALQGVHASQACTACHVNNVYRGTPRDCVGCHRTQYDRTTSPPHAAAGFPTTCDQCHRPTNATWRGVTFAHTTFALQGVHSSQACTACHVNNVYRGTPRDCVGCHRGDYDRTRNPNHASAGFPTTCDTCHRATDTAWTQGRFTHTWFPLTGPHNVTCAQCHTTANNFQQFNCTVCHARTETDNHHRGVNGYRYDSAACYACHPNGRH